jgi:hypothetical protein
MLNNLFDSLHRDGYIVIRNAINISPEIENQFDIVTENLTQQKIKERNINDKFTGVPSPLERSLEMSTQIMKCGGISKIIEKVFNNKVSFFGSDFGIFNGSSVFHRDVAFESPLYKMNIYLDHSYGKDQQMQFITGTHHVSDNYSRSVGKALYWPQGGGIDSQKMASILDLKTNNLFATLNIVNVEIQKGDIIIFDQRIIHSVEGSKLRKLISLTFMPNFELIKNVWSDPHTTPKTIIEYKNWFFLIKCVIRASELPRFKNYISSHKNLPFLNTKLGDYKFYDIWSESDFENATNVLFSSTDKSDMLRIIDPYNYKHS